MLEVCLRRRFGLLLQHVQVILHLIGLQFRGQFIKVKRYGSYVPHVIVERVFTSAQNGQVTLKAIKQIFESVDLDDCLVDDGV